MCCGGGVKRAASRQYVAPVSIRKTNAALDLLDDLGQAPPRESFWDTVPVIPDYPLAKKAGAYYGNPAPKKEKPS